MALLKTIAAVCVFIIALIAFMPLALLAFILSFMGLRKPMSFFVYKLAQIWAKVMILMSGCPLSVTGRENIPRHGGICIVSNHVGIFDIVLALALIGRPFGFIAKKELLLAPFVNIWVWLLGGLFIDRKNLKKAHHTIEDGIKRIKQGGAMIIFPEGTRSKGKGLQPFRSGSFKLATQAEALIIPMAVTGSYDVFEKTRLLRSVPLSVDFGDPISTVKLPPEERKQILSDRVHAIISEALDRTAPKAE